MITTETVTETDLDFLMLALRNSDYSNDPNTRVGAVIVSPAGHIISEGYNAFPTGIAETAERLSNREKKNCIVIHAEMSCLMQAYERLVPIRGCTLYLACTDDTEEVWSGPPCTGHCLKYLIQAGLTNIVGFPQKKHTKWAEELTISRELLAEAKITYREIDVPARYKHTRMMNAA